MREVKISSGARREVGVLVVGSADSRVVVGTFATVEMTPLACRDHVVSVIVQTG
jgi:hypothetical protein